MKHASLFSGIGGFDLAAQWMGWENVFQVEIDAFCQKVLAKNFPNVTRYGDIKQFDGTKYTGTIDIISGGFPCQPFSTAGSRKGENDTRFLWPEMLRIGRKIRPSFIVGENVAGITSLEDGKTLERVFNDLESIGYQVETFLIPASVIGTHHRRDRVWIIAHSDEIRLQRTIQGFGDVLRIPEEAPNMFSSFDASKWSLRKRDRGELRSGNGVPNWMDRIGSLGNAIVPQVAFEIFKTIDYLRYK